MREKARDLIYLNTKRYISLALLQVFYLLNIFFIGIIIILGFASIHHNGINWKSLFPIVSIVIWSLFYWAFVLTIRSKRTKKTFELRFVVNGISGLLLSSFFWILYTTISLVANKTSFDFNLALWILFFYVLFSLIYTGLIVTGVHNGIFKKIRKKSKAPKVIVLDAFFASLIPISGTLGILTSKWLRSHTNDGIQELVAAIGLIWVIFIPALAHMNFIQYYYCKKYKILCDEYGNAASPNLEPQIKVKPIKAKKETSKKTDLSNNSLSKKKLPLTIKILIGIVSVPLIFFIIVFIVSFIKVMIERI